MIRLILDQTIAPAGERLSDELVHAIESAINELVPNPPSGMIDAQFVDDREITRLNRMYRQKDSITDVLSFSFLDDQFDIDANSADALLGEVAICFAQAKRQMHEGDLELELTDLLVHGVLHVLGYDHEKPQDAKRMFPLQDKIVHTSL